MDKYQLRLSAFTYYDEAGYIESQGYKRMLPHEYSILGHSRTTIGRWLGVLSGAIASGLYLLAETAIHGLKDTNIAIWKTEIIFWPISAGVIYMAIHLLFNHKLWKSEWARNFLNIPDIAGTWKCEGKTMGQAGDTIQQWESTIIITQTWEKIKIFSNSGKGRSNSMIASLATEGVHGGRLTYKYLYEATAGEPVNSHVGFCDLSFNEDLSEAAGDYFNNKGRLTFGQMKLTRKE